MDDCRVKETAMKRLGMLLVVPPIVPERAIAQAAPAASVSTGPAVRATRVARAPRSCAQHVMKPVNSAATPSSLEGAQALRQGRTEPAMRDALSEPGGSVMSVSFRLLTVRLCKPLYSCSPLKFLGTGC